jgi:hypothetical protein
MNIGQSS